MDSHMIKVSRPISLIQGDHPADSTVLSLHKVLIAPEVGDTLCLLLDGGTVLMLRVEHVRRLAGLLNQVQLQTPTDCFIPADTPVKIVLRAWAEDNDIHEVLTVESSLISGGKEKETKD